VSIAVSHRQPLTLDLPGAGRLGARLESLEPGRVKVALDVLPKGARAALLARGAHVEVATARGVYRVEGRIEDGPGKHGVLTIALTGEPELHQRRDHVRVEAVRPLHLQAENVPGGRAISHTLNVSAGGMLIAGPEALAVGDRLNFRLDLGDTHPPVDAEAQVIRVDEDGARAIRIEAIGARAREAIIHFAFERQRLDRKLGRLA
jgi:c-di-GMP-binding flagellar brake protein YcgR